MNWQEIFKQAAQQLNMPVDTVENAYRSFWKFVKKEIEALPLTDRLSEEEFCKYRTNFNIPALGKLYCTYERYVGNWKRYDYLMNLKKRNAERKKDKTSVHQDSGDMQQV